MAISGGKFSLLVDGLFSNKQSKIQILKHHVTLFVQYYVCKCNYTIWSNNSIMARKYNVVLKHNINKMDLSNYVNLALC